MAETQELCQSTHNRCKQQDGRIKSLQESLQLTESHLSSSRAREAELELAVKDALQAATRAVQEMSKEREQAEDEEGIVLEEPSMLERVQCEAHAKLENVLAMSQRRCEEVEAELKDAKLNMEDLVLEIEAVAAEEEKTREQNARLLQQISEGQGQQKSMLQENFRLHQMNSDLKEKEQELMQRCEM
jgi:chromosome segregation ATPase